MGEVKGKNIAPRAKTARKLTAQQKSYTNLYASTGNKSQSAILTGYSPATADSHPVDIPHVSEIVISQIKSAVVSVNCTVEQIMGLLWDCAHKAAHEEKYRELVLITQELNKMAGNYAPLHTVNKSININTTLDKLKEARQEYSEF